MGRERPTLYKENRMLETSRHKRRQHPRVETRLAVHISTLEPECDPRTGQPFFRASQETSANLSRGGALLETTEPLTPGRRLLIEVSLPDGSPLEAIGRVAWTKRGIGPNARTAECGVEFLAGATEQLESLDAYLRKLIDT
ncbi:MAG TPA: PilZ domain-containing protein [Myxococcota bacterium]|nr:PilZ domain-containing protein [Myxococcota bacterium]MDP7298770.1 PilZ domain-containing protein [Myxococcota bacterium]HJO22243.1 PilZ domain-containing protein [Myxococcota bacterium]